ncbi:MAG: adenosylcobinamide-GDP ribazoletransferase, partial [Desulfuromonadaceae bacterium]
MKSLLAAIGFLTILPLPKRWQSGGDDLARSPAWFPAVGALLGAGTALVDFGLGLFLPPLVVSCCSVLLLLAASGGLHMDGLADTADGFFSGRNPERMLEIMRDSRSGPMGVMAICSLLLLKTVTLAAVPAPLRISTLVLMPLAGRTALTLSLTTLPYARQDGGLAGVFHPERWQALLAAVVLPAAGWLLQGLTGLVTAVVALGGT